MAICKRTGHGAGFKDLTGQRFTRLRVVCLSDRGPRIHWTCICDCGTQIVVAASALASSLTKSCGCLKRERIAKLKLRHNGTNSPEYRTWQGLKDRCTNPNAVGWKHYGGRGITVCNRWRDSFENFLADMGPKPSPNHSIDRIDVNGNYEPDNCRWATLKEQRSNTRVNRFLTLNGRTQTMQAWADELGVPLGRILARLKRGWTEERALTEPKHINQSG